LNSSLAQLAGGLWRCKVQQETWRTGDLKGVSNLNFVVITNLHLDLLACNVHLLTLPISINVHN